MGKANPNYLDRRPGSGSLSKQEAWASEQAQGRQMSNDGRSDTKTTLYYPGEQTGEEKRDRHQLDRDPEDRRSWTTLASWNDGVGDPNRAADNREADVHRWIDAFCSHLSRCTEWHQKRVEYVVSEFDSFENGPGRTKEKFLVAAISLVIDMESEPDPDEWTVDDWIVNSEEFEELMDDVAMDRDDLWALREIITDESSLFG